MTCHWIEEKGLVGRAAAFGCTRIKGPHTYDVIAAKLHGIHVAYNTDRKVQFTITDHGSNFIKAFKEFSQNEHNDDQKILFSLMIWV